MAKGIPVFHVLKREHEYKKEDLEKAVKNANKQIEFAANSIPIFAKHPKKGEKTPVLEYARAFELDKANLLVPGENKNMEKKDIDTVFAGVSDELRERIKNKEFPDRSIGFGWKSETKDSEPVPVITHVALLPEGYVPEIKFPDLKEEVFDFADDDIVKFTETFEADDNMKKDDKTNDNKDNKDNKDNNDNKDGNSDNKDGDNKVDPSTDTTVIMEMFSFMKQMHKEIMSMMPSKVLPDGGGNNLAVPLENFEAYLTEETFEAKLVDDTTKHTLSRDKLKETYKAASEGNFEEFVKSMIELSRCENFTAKVGGDKPDGTKYESDEDFEANLEPQRRKIWTTPESDGKTPQQNYQAAFPLNSEKERFNMYFKIK